MKHSKLNYSLSALALFLFITTALGQTTSVINGKKESTLTVAEIINKNIEARGGYGALKNIQTLIYSGGTYHEGDFKSDGNSFMAYGRPNYRIVGNPEDSTTDILEGYDGSAWEWYASPGVVVRTVGAANATARRGTDFEEPYVDYKEKNNKVVLGEQISINNKVAYQLIVTLPDEYSESYFIDSESFLLIAQRQIAPFHAFGNAIKTETRFSDFKKINGVVFAFNTGQFDISSGKLLNEIQWKSIKINNDVPYKWFLPPTYQRTILQNYLEQLYNERSDSTAIKWTYDNFNRFHPEINTEQGIEFIGYQILKMGEGRNSLLLLKLNEKMFPNSAVAAFGVGRAFNTIGDKKNARFEFNRSLKLDTSYKRSHDGLKALDND